MEKYGSDFTNTFRELSNIKKSVELENSDLEVI